MITRPTLRGSFGMVSSTHWLASQSAMAELEAGGNAFDAAVAAAFVLHVVEPHLNGPGGEVPAIFATARRPDTDRAVRPGPGAGGGDRRSLHGPRSRPDPRIGPHRGGRAGSRRRVAAAAARPRHPATARRAVLRRSAMRATGTRCCRGRPTCWRRWRRCSASTGRRPRRCGCGDGAAPAHWENFVNTEYADVLARLVAEGEAAGGGRRGRDRRRPTRLARGFRRRGGRRLPARAAPRRQRRRPRRAGHRRRHGELSGRRTSPPCSAGSVTSRSPRPARGARDLCCCSRWPCSTTCLTRSSTRRPPTGVHTVDRGPQAGLRRSRGVVRGRRRRADRRAARAGVRRRAPRPRRSDRVAGTAAGVARRSRATPRRTRAQGIRHRRARGPR